MTEPHPDNYGNPHNRQPKWLVPIVFIAAVIIICIATVLINRNSDKSTASTAKTKETNTQNSADKKEDPADTQDQDNDAESSGAQRPSVDSGKTNPQNGTEAQPQETGAAGTPETSGTDMSGDYMGTIECPLPPPASSYRCADINVAENNEMLMIYTEHIDNANFRFYITHTTLLDTEGEVSEEIIVPSHIAHYNGDGYYEYYEDNYHLYFRYYDLGRVTADKRIEVYGLDSLIDPNQYSEVVEYNGMIGNTFSMALPWAG